MVRLTDRVESPRVSVITIFLNERRFLREAIESVQAQTFSAWELILVDDGSSDGSAEIADAAAKDDARIFYLKHQNLENRGMSASRNLGIAAARGEFICFCDADDCWLPNKLAEQVALFDALPEAEMIYGRTLIWHSWQKDAVEADFCYDLGVTPNRLYQRGKLFPLLLRNRAQTPTTANAIMRRNLVARVGGFEETFRTLFEDQVFFAKAHLACSCYVDDRVWALYRQHASSCTGRSSGTNDELLARARFLGWLERYVKDRQLLNGTVRRSLFRARVDLKVEKARWRLRRLLRQ